MKQHLIWRSGSRSFHRATVATILAFTMTLWFVPGAQAQDDDARKILKTMADYVAGQQALSLTFDTDIEVITPDLQKIQFASSGNVQLNRPDKLRVTRTGGYSDVEMVFDGKTLSVHGKDLNAFTQLDAPGSVDQLIDRLRGGFGIAAPGADLLLTRAYDELTEDVVDAKYIGQGVVDGVECEHLAFRNPEVDWQLWVEVGARPIPRKYVITSKLVTGAPQYTLRIKEWQSDAPATADAFTFRPPQGAKEVPTDALASLDEVPPGVVIGGGK